MFKNIFVVFFLLQFSCNVFALDDVNLTSEVQTPDDDLKSVDGYVFSKKDDSLFSGVSVLRAPNGLLRKTQKYQGGLLNGLQYFYYDNGNLHSVLSWSNGVYASPQKFYFYKGGLESEGDVDAEGKKNGLWKKYYQSGALSEEIFFLNGVKGGVYSLYSESGIQLVKGNYIKNKKDGEWIYKNEKDQFVNVVNYKNGSVNGFYKQYQNGVLYAEGELSPREEDRKLYFALSPEVDKLLIAESKFEFEINIGELPDDVRKVGNWKEYYPTGVLKMEKSFLNSGSGLSYKKYYSNGNLMMDFKHDDSLFKDVEHERYQGVLSLYYEDGSLKETGFVIDGARHGVWSFYLPGDKIKNIFYYHKGLSNIYSIIESNTYFSTGKLKESVKKMKNSNVYKYNLFYESGKLAATGFRNIVKNKFYNVGDWKFYEKDGRLLRETGFMLNKRHGVEIIYFENGKVATYKKYHLGKRIK